MNLDSVTAGLLRPQCSLTERRDHLPDFSNGHFPATRAIVCHEGRRAYGLLPGQCQIRLAAGVGKLEDNLPAGLMNNCRHYGKTGNESIVMECCMPRPGQPFRADARVAGNYEATPPSASCTMSLMSCCVTLPSAVAIPSQVADRTKRLGKHKYLILVTSKMPAIYLNTSPLQKGTVLQPQGTSPNDGYLHSHTPCYRLPKTFFSRLVVWAAGLVLICFSSAPTMWNRPSKALLVT